MSGGRWHLVDLAATRYSYNFRVASETETHYKIERLFDGEVVQRMNLLKLSPHIHTFIGLMATPGAGKSSVADLLEKKGGLFYTSHKEVADVLKTLDVDEHEERDALQGLGSYLGANYPVVWVNQIIRKANETKHSLGWGDHPWFFAGWDSIRFPSDLILMRIAAGGSYVADETGHYVVLKDKGRFEVILVDADEHIRAKRSKKRARPGDPIGLVDYHRQEQNDRKVFLFDIARSMADHVVENNSTEDELAKRIDELWELFKKTHPIVTS